MTGVLNALLLAASLVASESPAPAPTPTPAPAPTPAPSPCPDVTEPTPEGAPGSWVDASHATVQRGINALVLRLDRFFGEPVHEPYDPPTSHIRLRNEVRTAEDDSLQARTAVAADLRLPAADRLLSRFSLLVTGESEPKPVPGTDVDRVPPRFDARVRAAGGGIELRYDLFRRSHTLIDGGAGVRFGWTPPPFTRVRLAQRFPLGLKVVGHLGQQVFWDRREGFGETTRLDVERVFGSRTLARWWSVGTVNEVSRGYEWTSEVGVQRVLGARTGLYTAAAIAGATQSVAGVDNYRLYTRLRRDVHRGWAFLEVEPEAMWPADEFSGRRSRVLGVILRLEILFSSDGVTPTPLDACDPPDGAATSRRAHPPSGGA